MTTMLARPGTAIRWLVTAMWEKTKPAGTFSHKKTPCFVEASTSCLLKRWLELGPKSSLERNLQGRGALREVHPKNELLIRRQRTFPGNQSLAYGFEPPFTFGVRMLSRGRATRIRGTHSPELVCALVFTRVTNQPLSKSIPNKATTQPTAGGSYGDESHSDR